MKREPVGPGEESVWDYPRPPAMEWVDQAIQVQYAGHRIADAPGAWKVMETSSPPTYYLPPSAVDTALLHRTSGRSDCEWKGRATYFEVRVPGAEPQRDAAWAYLKPSAPYAALAGHYAFYPHVLECTLAGEPVRPQPGRFYGGWITTRIKGPFKGAPGSLGW